MPKPNHSILPKQHSRKKSVGVRKVHNSFYERDRRIDKNLVPKLFGFLPYAGREYGFAYASAWDINQENVE